MANERVYQNPGFTRRQNISLAVLVVVVIYGFFELWRAFASGASDSTAALFGVLFVGGGIYGLKTMWDDSRALAVSLDVDETAGTARASLWRPFKPLVLEGPLSGFTGWRHFVKIGKRNLKTHYLLANVAGFPEPVQFEIPVDKPVADGLRRIAPGAVDDLETSAGIKRRAEESGSGA